MGGSGKQQRTSRPTSATSAGGAAAKRKKGSRGPSAERLAALAKPTDRVEFLETPAPYGWEDLRDSGKVPFVFRTGTRFPPGAPPLRDAIECNREAVEPKPHYAVISNGERWPPDKPQPVKKYDVERGLAATEPKTFAATFSTSQPRPPTPKAPDHIPDQAHLTIAHSRVSGGRFTNAPRSTAEHFILPATSPGPVYAVMHTQVDSAAPVARFSSQVRYPEPRAIGPGPLAYADAVVQRERLSTSKRAPNVVIGDVPNSSAMPFPYNTRNLCNSRSMRTAFCVSHSRSVTPSSRPGSAAASPSPSSANHHHHHMRGPPVFLTQQRAESAQQQHRSSRPGAADSVASVHMSSLADAQSSAARSALRHVLRTRAGWAGALGTGPAWASPFAAPSPHILSALSASAAPPAAAATTGPSSYDVYDAAATSNNSEMTMVRLRANVTLDAAALDFGLTKVAEELATMEPGSDGWRVRVASPPPSRSAVEAHQQRQDKPPRPPSAASAISGVSGGGGNRRLSSNSDGDEQTIAGLYTPLQGVGYISVAAAGSSNGDEEGNVHDGQSRPASASPPRRNTAAVKSPQRRASSSPVSDHRPPAAARSSESPLKPQEHTSLARLHRRPLSATDTTGKSSSRRREADLELQHAAATNRFVFATKYPARMRYLATPAHSSHDEDDEEDDSPPHDGTDPTDVSPQAVRADGAMRAIIAKARIAHPEGTLAERRARLRQQQEDEKEQQQQQQLQATTGPDDPAVVVVSIGSSSGGRKGAPPPAVACTPTAVRAANAAFLQRRRWESADRMAPYSSSNDHANN